MTAKEEGFGFMQQKQISGWVFDDGVVREYRLLNKALFMTAEVRETSIVNKVR